MQVNPSFGASNSLFGVQKPNDVHRSKFDLSRIRSFTAEPGMIIPFDTIPTLPGDDFDLSVDFALETMPLVAPSLTGYKVLIHGHFIRNRDIWRGWDNFITKGRTGNISLTIPRVDTDYASYSDTIREPISQTSVGSEKGRVRYYHNSVHSLSSFLGLPPLNSGSPKFFKGADGKIGVLKVGSYLPYSIVVEEDGSSDGIWDVYFDKQEMFSTGFSNVQYCSALPFMAYQNIVRNNYISQNLLQDCTALFPVEGDSDWLLPYAAKVTNFVGKTENFKGEPGQDNSSHTGVYSSSDKSVRLDYLRYVQFDDDYFTTALPWLQRGSSSNYVGAVNIDDLQVEIGRALKGTDPSGHSVHSLAFLGSDFSPSGFSAYKPDSVEVVNKSVYDTAERDPGFPKLSLLGVGNNVKGSLNFSINSLREAIALQVWQERNMRVDGSYNKMIYQHWRENPRVHEHYPEYIGGTFAQVNFSSILQQSESSSNSPLGSQAGRGVAFNSGNIGHFHCDDYGFIMLLMIIVPNTTYTQMTEHYLACENTFSDYPQPEFEGLSPQPILMKELCSEGLSSYDDQLFGYQERYTHYKTRLNSVSGMFAHAPGKERLFSSSIQARYFPNAPKLSYQFLCCSPNNFRRDHLAYMEYPMFKVQTATRCFAVRNLAYTSTPNTFGF